MIRSRGNRRIKDIRRLRRCKDDRALLEGPHLVAEALASGLVLDSVLAAPDFLVTAAGAALAQRLERPPLEVERRLLDGLCDADSPRGVLAVARLPRPAVESLPVLGDGVYLYVEGLQDPGNLGALARAAEGAGAAAMALSPGSVHPNHPRALRSSAGSLLRLPVAVGVAPGELDALLAAHEPRWLALAPRGGRDPARASLDGTLVLALGAEGPGLSRGLVERADERLTIPLAGRVESLNATVAAALVLFEIRRRRSRPGPSPAT